MTIKRPSRAEYKRLSADLVQQLAVMHAHVLQVNRGNAERNHWEAPANTLHGLVLRHGVGRYGAPLPAGVRKGADRLCFQHAFQLMASDTERFIYCEGYGVSSRVGFAFGIHAWVLDRQRRWAVVDNTWRNPVDGVYLGLPLNPDYVINRTLAKKTYGLLDDWQSDFPLLQHDPAFYLHPDRGAIAADFAADAALTDGQLLPNFPQPDGV